VRCILPEGRFNLVVKPFLKYAGGKARLVPELKKRMPLTWHRYFEPFVGGGALFFDVQPAVATLGDINGDLIDVYHALARDPERVINKLTLHHQRHRYAADEDYYYIMRELWNDHAWEDDQIGRTAAFIYLNRTCFNGLWRVNSSGAFNVPKGKYADPKICNAERLLSCAKALDGTKIECGDYLKTTAGAIRGDFLYCDPPYVPMSKTSSFTSYDASGFGEVEQRALADHARALARRGVYVMLSNSDVPFVHELYDGFHIDVVECNRAINSKAAKRGKVNEVIITSYQIGG